MKRMILSVIPYGYALIPFVLVGIVMGQERSTPACEFRAGGGFIFFLILVFVIIKSISFAKVEQPEKSSNSPGSLRKQAESELAAMLKKLRGFQSAPEQKSSGTGKHPQKAAVSSPAPRRPAASAGSASRPGSASRAGQASRSGFESVSVLTTDFASSPQAFDFQRSSDAMIAQMPLWEAAGRGKLDVARRKLEQGANVNETDTFFSETPLHRAAKNGDAAMVQLLLKYRADVTLVTNYAETPLHFAIQGRSPEVVKLLLHAGANPQTKDCFGRTPVQCAKFYPELRACFESAKP